MQASATQLTAIQKKLAILPAEKLQQVMDFVDFILSQAQVEHKKIIKLGGTWKNRGFEKIENLEAEISKIRHEASKGIINKEM